MGKKKRMAHKGSDSGSGSEEMTKKQRKARKKRRAHKGSSSGGENVAPAYETTRDEAPREHLAPRRPRTR